MPVKYIAFVDVKYNSLITEYVIEKTTSGWFSDKIDTFSVYKISRNMRCYHKDGKEVSPDVYKAIEEYEVAQEIERCLSI